MCFVLPVIPMAMVLQVALLVAGCAAGSSVPADHLGAPHKWVPVEQCSFANPPVVPYYWDPNCTNDLTSLGCWADGVHAECRFCGEEPYTGVHCPLESITPSKQWCQFDEAPVVPLLGVYNQLHILDVMDVSELHFLFHTLFVPNFQIFSDIWSVIFHNFSVLFRAVPWHPPGSSGIPAASKGCWDALLMASTWAAGSVVKVTTLRLSAPHQPAPLPTSPSRLTIGTPCAAWGCWDAMLTPFTCSAASVTTSHFTPCGAPVGHDLPTRMESVGFPTARAKAISGTPAASGARLAAGPMVSMLTAATVDQGLAGCMKALAALRILSFHRPPEG